MSILDQIKKGIHEACIELAGEMPFAAFLVHPEMAMLGTSTALHVLGF